MIQAENGAPTRQESLKMIRISGGTWQEPFDGDELTVLAIASEVDS